MSGFRYGAALLLAALVMSAGVVLVLARLRGVDPSVGSFSRVAQDSLRAVPGGAAQGQSATPSRAAPATVTATDAAPNTTGPAAAPGPLATASPTSPAGELGAPTPVTPRPAARTARPQSAASTGTRGAPPAPAFSSGTRWQPSVAQAFADSLYLAVQAADTARQLALLSRRPADLPEPGLDALLRLEARLARATRDTARARRAYDQWLRTLGVAVPGADPRVTPADAASRRAEFTLGQDPSADAVREAAEAAREAGDARRAVQLLAPLLAAAPADTSLRAAFVERLLEAGDSTRFVAQLDTLAQLAPSAARFERLAVTREARGDLAGARVALREAVRLDPSADRWTQLGDRLRWSDSLDAALAAYGRALALQPGQPRTLEGTAIASRLRREATPSPLFIAAATPDPEAGIGTVVRAGDDNAGWRFRALGLEVGLPTTARGPTLLAAAELRQVGRPAAPALNGSRWSAGLAQPIGRARVAVRAGQVRHDGVTAVTAASGEVRVPLGRLEARALASRDVAYELLRAGATLAPGTSDTALTARTLRATLLGEPVAGVELWSQLETVRLGDGNRRHGVQVAVQRPLRPGVSLVVTGGLTGFDRTTPVYWSPSRFTLGAVGLDLRTGDPARGQLYARVLPGIGDVRGLAAGNGTAIQLSGNAGAVVQRGPWRAALDLAGGRDRDGGYRTWAGELRVTRTLP